MQPAEEAYTFRDDEKVGLDAGYFSPPSQYFSVLQRESQTRIMKQYAPQCTDHFQIARPIQRLQYEQPDDILFLMQPTTDARYQQWHRDLPRNKRPTTINQSSRL